MSGIVEFRSGDEDGVLRLSLSRMRDGFGSFGIQVEAEGLSCELTAETLGGDGLHEFIGNLATDWRGFAGVRRWNSLENDLIIEATHSGRRVELLCTVQHGANPDTWQVRLPILVEPGESLARLATQVAAL